MAGDALGLAIERPVTGITQDDLDRFQGVATRCDGYKNNLNPNFFTPLDGLVAVVVEPEEIAAVQSIVGVTADRDHLEELKAFIDGRIDGSNRPGAMERPTRQADAVDKAKKGSQADLIIARTPQVKSDRGLVLAAIASFYKLGNFPKEAQSKNRHNGVAIASSATREERPLIMSLKWMINNQPLLAEAVILDRIVTDIR